MASLKKGDLDKRGNDEILLKKFFSLDNRMNTFLCKTQSQEGQFVPLGLVFMVDGDEIAGFQNDQSKDYDEALARLRENMKLAGTRNKVFFTGTWQNTKQIETISLTDLEKTDEFGGQVGGKKVNLGIQFENDFYKSLQCELQCEDKNTKYKKDARKLVDVINESLKIKGGLSGVEAVGGKNQPRPLMYSGGLYVTAGGKKTKEIGSTVTDITTVFGGKKEIYLSLKFGDTLTFINSGVGKVFLQKDYEKSFEGYNNSIGNAIFDMFAIDKIEYANVFNKYGKGYTGKKVDVTRKANKRAIEDLLEYAIGYGYYMVHAKGSTVDCYEMSKAYMQKAARINGKIMLHYGGASGKGKRLDMHLESSVYKFMFNLRNKQGGKYPSHIMCDYKKK